MAAVFQCLKGVPKKTAPKFSINDLNDLNFVFIQRVSVLKGYTKVLRQRTIP